MTTAPEVARSFVPSAKSQKNAAGLAASDPSSGSLLAEPSNRKQVPGTPEVQLESAIWVAVKLAVGGALPIVIVSEPVVVIVY